MFGIIEIFQYGIVRASRHARWTISKETPLNGCFVNRGMKENTEKWELNDIIWKPFFPYRIAEHLLTSRFSCVFESLQKFVQGLSILSRGTLEEKLCWTFQLYDINSDGHITKEEMNDIVTAIYNLMGHPVEEKIDEDRIKTKVDRIFDVSIQASFCSRYGWGICWTSQLTSNSVAHRF